MENFFSFLFLIYNYNQYSFMLQRNSCGGIVITQKITQSCCYIVC